MEKRQRSFPIPTDTCDPMTPSQAPPQLTHLPLTATPVPLQPCQHRKPLALGQFVHLEKSSLLHSLPLLPAPHPQLTAAPSYSCKAGPEGPGAELWDSPSCHVYVLSPQNSPWLCRQSSPHSADEKGGTEGLSNCARSHTQQ